MKLNSYEKLKYLIMKILNNDVINKNQYDLEYEGISKDTYAKFITKLNQIGILTSLEKGTNKIKSDFINTNYFFNLNFNSSIISSVLHSERKIINKDVLQYLFNKIPKKIVHSYSNDYTKKFNEDLLSLIDNDKYYYFAGIVKENKNSNKIVCSIQDKFKNKSYNIVPLELFLYQNSWYICCYSIYDKSLVCIDSFDISYVSVISDIFSEKIDIDEIENTIEKFVDNNNKINILVKIKPETLNILYEHKKIEDYSIYETRQSFKHEFSSNFKYVNNNFEPLINPKASILRPELIERENLKILKRNKKIQEKLDLEANKEQKKERKRLFKIDFRKSLKKNGIHYMKETYDKHSFSYFVGSSKNFDYNISLKYFAKIILKEKDFDYIIKNFDIEIVDESLYRI